MTNKYLRKIDIIMDRISTKHLLLLILLLVLVSVVLQLLTSTLSLNDLTEGVNRVFLPKLNEVLSGLKYKAEPIPIPPEVDLDLVGKKSHWERVLEYIPNELSTTQKMILGITSGIICVHFVLPEMVNFLGRILSRSEPAPVVNSSLETLVRGIVQEEIAIANALSRANSGTGGGVEKNMFDTAPIPKFGDRNLLLSRPIFGGKTSLDLEIGGGEFKKQSAQFLQEATRAVLNPVQEASAGRGVAKNIFDTVPIPKFRDKSLLLPILISEGKTSLDLEAGAGEVKKQSAQFLQEATRAVLNPVQETGVATKVVLSPGQEGCKQS